nr:E3 ubiquitin-protein ligase SINAT5-like [Ipomoea batatas]GMD31781.1 E3 ubiquitin-protein ligase SINAT5-like [Ipomoea batatas]
MATGSLYFDDLRSNSEVIDSPPQTKDMMDVGEHVNETTPNSLKPNPAVSSSVRELLECPVCLNAMYPPIHQARISFWSSHFD